MKKKVILTILTMVAVASLSACSGSKEPADTKESVAVTDEQKPQEGVTNEGIDGVPNEKTPLTADMALKDVPVEEYVVLGDYKDIKVSIPTAGEEEIDVTAKQLYNNMYPAENGVTDRAVEKGDTANIDYQGKRDGVAFDGGTAEGANLTIGSGQFIDGFEDGLIGVNPGETVDLNLKFPENYGNEDLAGAAVVFTVKVNYIIPEQMDDTIIANMGIPDVSDKAGLYKYVEDYINSFYTSDISEQVLSSFLSTCQFETMPQVLIDQYKGKLRDNMTQTAASNGMDVEQYMNTYYGSDLETFVENYAEQQLQMNMACQAVANKEHLGLSDEELEKKLAEFAEANQISVEELLTQVTKEDYREYHMYESVLTFLTDMVKNQ